MPDDKPWLITIAASAGGIQALQTLLSQLPSDLPAAVVIVQHRTPTVRSLLTAILAKRTRMEVRDARDGDRVAPGIIYIARPDLHLTIGPGQRFMHVDGARVRGLLSSANPLLDSVAGSFKDRAIAVVLTGSGMDATDGVQAVKAHGGIVIAQDPATAEHRSMPASAINTGAVDFVLPLEAIPLKLAAIVGGGQMAAAAAMR